MNSRDDLTAEDLRHLKEAYHSTQWSLEEICDRFGFAPGALRQFAHRREWKRPTCLYRKGVARKEIPAPRRETAQLLWESGENCDRIGRWIGVSPNTAHALCSREFGFRNLRLNKQTYFFRRNLQMLAMAEAGVAIEEIADHFWLGPKSVRELIARTRRTSATIHRVPDGDLTASLERCEAHERVLHAAVATVAEGKTVPGQLILWPTRGRAPVAAARGMGMYLVHVEASYSLSDTGMLFGRDRTTVAHACALVEDARDDHGTDTLMDGMAERFLARIAGAVAIQSREAD